MHAPFDQADAENLYEQMRSDQRTAVALEFVRCLRLAEDPFGDQFMAEANQAEQAGVGSVAEPPHLLSAQQAAAIHRYTFDHRPDCFAEVLHHPLTQAVLAAPGTDLEPEPEPESGSLPESPPTQKWPL